MVERAGSEAGLGFEAHPHMLRHDLALLAWPAHPSDIASAACLLSQSLAAS
jgi:hypothetical protein